MNPQLEQALIYKGKSRLPSILMAAAECSPLSKTGGLADMAGALPKALNRMGFDARVITPYHRCIKERYADQVQHMAHIYVDLGWRHQYAGLEKLVLEGLVVYLIDNESYFGDAIYRGGDPEVEQYAFFQRAVMEAIPLLDYTPDILHCNDWHTALLPFLVKTQYAGRPQGALKTVLSIHNLAFQGWLSRDAASDLMGIDPRWFGDDGLGHKDCANFLKGGCLFADKVNTVSPTYADEIRTPFFGEGLDGVLLRRDGDVSGILNGLDIADFNPATDPNLPFHYDAERPENKQKDKEALLQELGLTVSPDVPVIAMVTRMTWQKGFDLVLQSLDALMAQNVCFILLGSGDRDYEDAMRGYEYRYKGRLCAYIGYSEPLARRIYAGADFLLMPSAFEPCGLSQMIAMRYGTLPIVHEVGGLRDTVSPYNVFTGEGDGFSFYDFDRSALLGTIAFALSTYYSKEALAKLIHAAMTRDVSLDTSAVEYARLYLSILPNEPSPLYHEPFSERYRYPFGAVRCGQNVMLRLKAMDYLDRVDLIANDEVIPMRREEDGFFVVDFAASDQPGLIHYCFRFGCGLRFGADGLDGDTVRPWQLTVYDPAFHTPDWAEGAVMYQIFPDRYSAGGDAFEHGVRYHRELGRNIEVHEYWDDPVKFWPTTKDDYAPDDFYGGTLEGIRDRLPELRELGIDCIYLNPVFEAESNHRYNTANYNQIDPMLGTEEDFRALCDAARELGIHIILDGVFSHTGDDSVYFNRPGRYKSIGAYQGEESPFYSWYDFRTFPDDYRCWWGFRTLPEVNETDPAWQEFVITGENAVMKKWLRAGADGWRLDVADELPDEVIDKMRESVKSEKPDALLIGEVWEDATSKISYGQRRCYALGGGLDSVMNYPLRKALLDYALWKTDALGLRNFLAEQKMNYPAPMYRCLMNHLGTHDTARLRTVLGTGMDGSDMSRDQQAGYAMSETQNAWGRALQRLCATLQFALPGMPCVYYGDEEGMIGFRDPFCRAPYRKAEGEESLRDFYAELAKTRNEHYPLRHGDAAFAAYGPDVIIVLRYNGSDAVLVAVNRGRETIRLSPVAADFVGLSTADGEQLGTMPELEIPPVAFVTIPFHG